MIQPKVILDYSSCVNRKANHDLERCMKSQKHMFFFLEFFCSFFSSSMSLVSLGNVSLNIIKMFQSRNLSLHFVPKKIRLHLAE